MDVSSQYPDYFACLKINKTQIKINTSQIKINKTNKTNENRLRFTLQGGEIKKKQYFPEVGSRTLRSGLFNWKIFR